MKICLKSAIIILTAYLLNYLTSIILANNMGPDGFGDYSAAVAWSLIFTIVITLGLEKFSRQILPKLKQQKKWRIYRSFITYSIKIIMVAGFGFAVIFIGCYFTYNKLLPFEHNHPAVITVVLFLPITGLIRFLAEIINVNRGFIPALLVAQLQPVIITLLFILIIIMFSGHINPVYAILAYGLSWLFCLPTIRHYLKKFIPNKVWEPWPKYQDNWWREALPYLVSSLAILASVKCALVILEIMQVPEAIVGYYAAIDLILFFLVTISILTNQYFAPRLATEIAENNFKELNSLLKIRFRFLTIFLTLFCLMIMVFGKKILTLFGPGFVYGYIPLCLGSILMSITVLLYISSVLLQYLGKKKTVAKSFLVMLACSVLLVILLTLTLTTHVLIGAVIGITVPTIAILTYQTILLAKQHKISVCTI